MTSPSLELHQLGERQFGAGEHGARLDADFADRGAEPLAPLAGALAALVMRLGGELGLDRAQRGDGIEEFDRAAPGRARARRRSG